MTKQEFVAVGQAFTRVRRVLLKRSSEHADVLLKTPHGEQAARARALYQEMFTLLDRIAEVEKELLGL